MTFEQMLWPWEPSITVLLAFSFAAAWYLRRSTNLTLSRRCAFWLGFGLCYIALHTGLDYYAQHEFFMHRVQHLLLHHVGPFLIALGLPPTTLNHWREPVPTRTWKHVVLRSVTHPLVSTSMFNLVVLFWLLPAIHFPAMLDWRLYRLMNWSVLASGLLFWTLVLRGAVPWRAPLALYTRVALMLAVIPVQIMLGALLFLAPGELYPVYSMCGRVFRSIDALADQQVGALILWIPGAMMSIIGILLILRSRFSETAPAAAGAAA